MVHTGHMFTTRMDSAGPQTTVILLKDGKEIARMTLDEFIRLKAVQYVVKQGWPLLQAHLSADELA